MSISKSTPLFSNKFLHFCTTMMTTTALTFSTTAGAYAQTVNRNILPQGSTVIAGQVAFANSNNNLLVNQTSDHAIVNWDEFSIGKSSAVHFNNGEGATLNRVEGHDISAIDGRLSSTGSVYLINDNGIIIGKDGVVQTGGDFVASTLDIGDDDFLNGGDDLFAGNGNASVVNLGKVSSLGGDVMFIAQSIHNEGELTAANGTVGLAAGREILLRDFALNDGKFVVKIGDANGKISEQGLINAANVELRAKGGNIYALAGNSGGAINATGMSKRGGRIFLTASGGKVTVKKRIKAKRVKRNSVKVAGGDIFINADLVQIASLMDASGFYGGGGNIDIGGTSKITLTGASLDASGVDGGRIRVGGEYQGGKDLNIDEVENVQKLSIDQDSVLKADANGAIGNGGEVVAWADDTTIFDGFIFARGGKDGGNGGQVETSGKKNLGVGATAHVNTLAANGKVGDWLLDPENVTITAAGDPDLNNIGGGGHVKIAAIAINGASTGVSISATNNITFNDEIIMTVGGIGLTATAGNKITVKKSIKTNNGNVSLISDKRAINASIDVGTADILFDRATKGQFNLAKNNGLDASELANLHAKKLIIGNPNSTKNKITGMILNAHDYSTHIKGRLTLNALGSQTANIRISSGQHIARRLSFNANNRIVFRGDITTKGNQNYTGDVVLKSNTKLKSNSNKDITFNSKLDGKFNLVVNTGGGAIFNGLVGSQSPLGKLTIKKGKTYLNGSVAVPASVTTVGDQNYIGEVIINGKTDLKATGVTSDIVLTEGLSSTNATTGKELTIMAGDAIAIGGNVQFAGGANINLVSGWDGSTFDPSTLNKTHLGGKFGNVTNRDDAGVTFIGTSGAHSASVGSREGKTRAYAAAFILNGSVKDTYGLAQFGYETVDSNKATGDISVIADYVWLKGGKQDGTYALIGHAGIFAGASGGIDVKTVYGVDVVGGGVLTPAGAGSHEGIFAQIGHAGNSSSNSLSGTISVTSDGFVYLLGGKGNGTYAQVGHGGAGSRSMVDGNITVTGGTTNQDDIVMKGGRGEIAYAQIGHGGRGADTTMNGNIKVETGNDIDVLGGKGNGSYSQIGHGGANSKGIKTGFIDIISQDDIHVHAGRNDKTYAQIGHGGLASEGDIGGTNAAVVGKIDIYADDKVEIIAGNRADRYAQIGHGAAVGSSKGARKGDVILRTGSELSIVNNGSTGWIGHQTTDGDISKANMSISAATLDALKTASSGPDIGSGGDSAFDHKMIDSAMQGGHVSIYATDSNLSLGGTSSYNSGFDLTVRASHDIVLDANEYIINAGGGDIILAAGKNFHNDSGSTNPLRPSSSGRFLVYSTDWDLNTKGDMSGGNLYGRDFDKNPPSSISQYGDQFIYKRIPILTITGIDTVKTYNGNAHSLSGYNISGLVNGDSLSEALTSGPSLGSHTNAGVYTSGLINSDAVSDMGYGFSYNQGQLTIDKALLSIGVNANDKVYDSTIKATITYNDSRFSGDQLTVNGKATFGNKNVGTNKLVSITDVALSGADAGNYYLAGTDFTDRADITKAQLVVSADAADKVYDATVAATATLTDNRFAGDQLIVNGSAIATFDNKNAGKDKLVTVNDIILTGVDAGNYYVNNVAYGHADITKAPLNVTALDEEIILGDAPYSGGNGVLFSGLVGEDIAADLGGNVTYGGTSQGATDVGIYGIVPDGLTSNNYELIYAEGMLSILPSRFSKTLGDEFEPKKTKPIICIKDVFICEEIDMKPLKLTYNRVPINEKINAF